MRMWTEVDKESGVSYALDIEPEPTDIKGNAMASGDAAVDRRAEVDIRRQLRSGNQWAWCVAICTASKGSKQGRDTLGCCSYKDTEQFLQPGGYWDDMKTEARRDLESKEVAITDEYEV